MNQMKEPLLQLNHVWKIFDANTNRENPVLKDISLEIMPGEMVAIIGDSGSGKTTLLNILGCVVGISKGKYVLDQKEIDKANSNELAELRNRYIGFVMQDFGLLEDENIYNNVKLPLIFNENISLNESSRRIDNALSKVGLLNISYQKIKYLSGGQKQKVAIARAIVCDPSILLADEPTGALDSKASDEIMSLFKTLNQQGVTVIIVTHSMKIAEACHRVIKISDGKLYKDLR